MKKYISSLILIVGASLRMALAEDPSPTPSVKASLSASIEPSATPSPEPSIGLTRCPVSSASVEVHTFYGSVKTVLDKVKTLPVELSERRVFVQITQSGRTKCAKTSVKLFEQKDGRFMITEWADGNISRLSDEIDDTIIRDKGKTCVGEAIKAVLQKQLSDVTPSESSLPAATKPGDAFGPAVQGSTEDFITTEVVFGC